MIVRFPLVDLNITTPFTIPDSDHFEGSDSFPLRLVGSAITHAAADIHG